MTSAQRGLNEQSNGRFLLGIGVSHAPTVSTLRGHLYGKPVATSGPILMRCAQQPIRHRHPLSHLPRLSPRLVLACSHSRPNSPMGRTPTMSRRSTLLRRDAFLVQTSSYIPSRWWYWRQIRLRRGASRVPHSVAICSSTITSRIGGDSDLAMMT